MTTDVALIAVFGAVGAGKTTFVNDASGSLGIGNESYTSIQDIQRSPIIQVGGQNVVLFDTPGFDDTHLSEIEVLKRIVNFLKTSYQSGYKLTGVIYLHRITDTRLGGISRRTFSALRKLCGNKSLSNVLIVTNMWTDPPTTAQIAREAELLFQPALQQGATLVRRTHRGTESAHDIIRLLLNKALPNVQLQEAVVDRGKTLSGPWVEREVPEPVMIEHHETEILEPKITMEDAWRGRTQLVQKNVPKLIALFGATGTGKTTFVNDASGSDLQVGDELESCTQDVWRSPSFQLDGHEIVLFDTPGFDDTELSDTEILKRITGFLTSSYEKGYKLTGVIYLHRITDIRMSGMSRRTFKILRELCGQETLSNVLIVTNMWSDPPTAKQLQTEKQLQESSKFFEPAIKAGARMVRRPRKDADSAHDIIRLLLDKAPVAMKIQRQIVDDGEGFYSTDAVRVLGEELAEAEQRHQQEIEEVKKELRKAKEQNDVQTQIELREYLEQATAESARLFKEIQALREGFDEERLRWEKRVDAAEEARLDAERKQTELVEQLEQLRLQAEEARGRERSILENAMAEVLSKMAELKRNQQSWGCVIM